MNALFQVSRIDQLNRDLELESPQKILEIALEEVGQDQLALVSSFGAESAVLLHMWAKIDRYLPVIFLETGFHFPATQSYRDRLIDELGLQNVRLIAPNQAHLHKYDPQGDLNRTDADMCCNIRKVIPLENALKGMSGWVTGRKRIHGGVRSNLPIIEESGNQIKVNPLANWKAEDIERYFLEYQLPKHPLLKEGYTSIGCYPCTAKNLTGDNPRAGRWAGSGKTECGIHLAKTPSKDGSWT